MAYSWQAENAVAGQELIKVNLKYLDRDDILITIDGTTIRKYTWDSDKLVRLPQPLLGGEVIMVVRRTARRNLWVSFAEGTPFDRTNLDAQNTQFLYLAQEISEGVGISSFFNDIDMNSYRIINLGTPIDDSDAATKAYVDRVTAAAIGSGDRAEAAALEAEKSADSANTAWEEVKKIIGGAGTIVNSINGEYGDVTINSKNIGVEDTGIDDMPTNLGEALATIYTNFDNLKKQFHTIFIVDVPPLDGDGQDGDIWMIPEDD